MRGEMGGERERENPLLSSFSERIVEKELDFLSNSFPCWLMETGMWEHQSLHDMAIPYSIANCLSIYVHHPSGISLVSFIPIPRA